jgi:hypothetical protein
MHQAFIESAEPILSRWDARSASKSSASKSSNGARNNGASNNGASNNGDAAAFADYVRALTDWRRLPFLDPGLPAELLPPGWPGARATEVFGALRARLAGPARAHVLAVTGRPARSG